MVERISEKHVGAAITRWLINLSFYKKRLVAIVVDAVALVISLWAALALRMEMFWPQVCTQFSWLFLALPLLSLPVFVRIGLYRAVIRYSSLDVLGVVTKSLGAAVVLLVGLVLVGEVHGFSRSSFLSFAAIAGFLIGGSRLGFRSLYFRFCKTKPKAKRTLIYGAGSSGAQMVIAFQLSSEFEPVALVDDKQTLQGRQLHGLRIYSPGEIPELVDRLSIDLILLAMPSASRKRMREILLMLEPYPVEVKALPFLDILVSGTGLGIQHIRDIQIEDLLGRDPVPPRMSLIHSCVDGKNVMVTGAGGSIGSELCRQIAACNPRRLVLFERSEFALYTIEAELRERFEGRFEIIPILGSVCRKRRVLSVLKTLGIHTIYHAAAYKHVPLVEQNPIEGVRNNLFGTWKTAESAMEAGVETFVLISTDKAVRPTNVMGASKRMAELVLQALAAKGGHGTRFTMVRFGNVLGSSGSVVPLFREQIRKGGPVTVTHPDVVRYFMTIPEAVQLVLQAGAMGRGGDVFVLDMGEPVRIYDLARKMIRLYGHSVRDQDNPLGSIAITFNGLRPGEKLYEELLVGGNVVGTNHPMIMRAEEDFFPWDQMAPILETLDAACRHFNHEQIRSLLLDSVDGYRPQCEIVDPVYRLGMLDGLDTNRSGKVTSLSDHKRLA